MRLALITWCLIFFVPLAIMLALDGFCSGGELCRAGLYFTLLLYGAGLLLFLLCVLVARLIFRAFRTSPSLRLRTMKALLLIPVLPGIIVLGLLLRSLL